MVESSGANDEQLTPGWIWELEVAARMEGGRQCRYRGRRWKTGEDLGAGCEMGNRVREGGERRMAGSQAVGL